MVQINAQHVSARIDEWVDRLNELYDKIEDWMQTIPHDRTERDTLRQTIEPFMRQFQIPPRDVPTYTIFRGKKRIAFVPAALWVTGTNGRVNITTNEKQHILVDRGDTGNGSKWELVVDD